MNNMTTAERQKMEKTKMITKLLFENLRFEVSGWYLALEDGDLTEEEYKEELEIESLKERVEVILSNAYEKGVLQSPDINGMAMEAKHIKFLGKDQIAVARDLAVMYVLQAEGIL